ncbi:MAG: DUF1365 domain-containing protein [Marinovum sp.]|nr:DUF1365 domain-containing protein [Marinovum sp.]
MGAVDHIEGHTWHGRKGGTQNAFRYSVDFVMLDAEAKDVRTPWLFRRNGRGLTSLLDKDHGGQPHEGRGAAWAREVLEAHQIHLDGPLMLLAQPRVLGHVFNPVSFWLAYDAGHALKAVISEVTNTYGDRHSYLCYHPDLRTIEPHDKLRADKIFHVSPFQPIEGGYTFRFDIRDDRIGVWIDYSSGKGGLIATLTGERKEISNASILRAVIRRPLGSRRVLGLIHWQALKLWFKGVRFRSRPEPPTQEVSR